jgi:hypothetical protein
LVGSWRRRHWLRLLGGAIPSSVRLVGGLLRLLLLLSKVRGRIRAGCCLCRPIAILRLLLLSIAAAVRCLVSRLLRLLRLLLAVGRLLLAIGRLLLLLLAVSGGGGSLLLVRGSRGADIL